MALRPQSLASATLLLACCVGTGEIPARISGQLVGLDEEPLGSGMVLIERGPVHNGTYEFGVSVDDYGRFSAELPNGGTWGLHLYRDDYLYVPLEITIEEHQQVVLTNLTIDWGPWMDLTGQPAWPDQPSDATLLRLPWDEDVSDNPILHDVSMRWVSDELLEVTAEVSDPTHDLSRMILAHDTVTGFGYALNPPSPPDAEGNYPEGVYSMLVYADPRHVPGESVWQFAVSDNLCNDTPIWEITVPER